MKHLMLTWTDVFYGIGDFCQLIFKGMKMLGHSPNVLIWIGVAFAIGYWTVRLMRYKKEAQRNGTIE